MTHEYEICMTLSFLRILKIVSPESFILLFFSVKVITVILSEGGYVLSLSQNDKTSNIW